MATLSTKAIHQLGRALGDRGLGEEVATVLQKAASAAETAQGSTLWAVANAITATAVSQTTDFGSLRVGDKVVMIPAVAGNADFIGPIAVLGDLGQAAVVGNLYLVLRPLTLPADVQIRW